MGTFVSGWHPDFCKIAAARLAARGVFLHRIKAGAVGQIPPAWSLSASRLRHLEQGGAGTCWVHSAVQLAETFGKAAGYDAFPIARRLVGWQGTRLAGGGNMSNGGSPVDAVVAMTGEAGKGVGIGHEALWAYTDNYRELARSPTEAILDDAKTAHIAAPIEVTSDDDARTLIANNSPVANGIWWPYAWDRQDSTLINWIGAGTYGHALTEMGYVTKGTWPGEPGQHDWFQLDNWHGLLYSPLTPELAAHVPGYAPITPTKTSDFWVRADVYATVRGYGNAIRCSATDLDGLARLCTLADTLAWPS